MKSLVIALLIGSIFPRILFAQERAGPIGVQTGTAAASSAAPSQSQHRQTDQDFLSERARRNGSPAGQIAELESIQARLQSLRARLQSLESEPASASAQEHILLGRQVGTAGEPDSEKRIPDTLTHRDRAVTDADEYGRVKVRISALEESVNSELARLRQLDSSAAPATGAGRSPSRNGQAGETRFGDGIRGRRLPTGDSGDANGHENEPVSGSKRILQLQRDVDAAEREVENLERQYSPSARKKPGRLK